MKTFEARVTKDSLVFSAAHFITLNGNICERLHGHNWRVDVVVAGGLDENQYVYDFLSMRVAVQNLVNQLDHHVLLPDCHPMITVESDLETAEVTARFKDRRWVFPGEDCVVLPMANTTAELIAEWFVDQLLRELNLQDLDELTELRVGVEENFGQWAWCRCPL